MNATPKTIQIFLPGGDPRGIRIAEITTRIVQAIEVPRSLLSTFNRMDESRQVAVYFLFGSEDGVSEPSVYIGQTGDLRARLSMHNQKKDFWQHAVVLISRTNSLTQTHALFLEWYSLQEAKRSGRYADENGNAGTKPHTPAPLEADCMEIFETGRTLLATLGYPLFEAVRGAAKEEGIEELFFCNASGAKARGLYTTEGFVVLKDSLGRRENVKSLANGMRKQRQALVQNGVMREEADRVIFLKDHLFKSPSMAGIAVLGRHSNGWTDWKAADGRTLSEIKRTPVEPTDQEL